MNITKFETEQTMTLKEITDLLEVRHDNAMNIVAKMVKNPDFGTAPKIKEQYTKGNNAIGEIETYQLNKRQSIAVAARLNTSLLMRIIDRWQELEDEKRKPLTTGEMLVKHANRFLEVEREQERLAKEQVEMKAQLAAIVDGEDFFTIVGYCNMTHRRLTQKDTSRMGK